MTLKTDKYTKPILLCLITLATLLLTGCGTTTSQAPVSKPKPATTTITYDKDYIKNFRFDAPDSKNPIRTPEGVAKTMRDRGKKYYTDAYAKPNGKIIATVTKQQKKNLIKDRNHLLQISESSLSHSHEDYHANIDQKTRTLSVWTDKSAATDANVSIYLLLVPAVYGDLYYINGNTGPWDMTIKVYDCHTGQPVQQYMASQGDQFDPTKMPE